MPKISVIIPVYNAEKYIDKMINSILCQTITDIEIIIINDASTDNSLSICNNYAKEDSRIKVISKDNEGVSKARNLGMECSKGEYIMFLDADDWVENDMCEIMYNKIKLVEADICFCNHIMEFDNRNEKINFGISKCFVKKEEIAEEVILPLIEEKDTNKIHLRASFRSPWGKLFKRSIIIDNNIRFKPELSIGEDFIFDIEYLSLANKVTFIDNYLYHYRINNQSALNRYKDNTWTSYKKLLNFLQEFLEDKFNESEYIDRLNRLKLKYLLICIRNEMKPQNSKSILQKQKYIKEICEDEIIYSVIQSNTKALNKKKDILIMSLLKNKIYFPFALYSSDSVRLL